MDELVTVRQVGTGYEITPTPGFEATSSLLVAAGISMIKDVPPERVTPTLSRFVDPDALDALVEHSPSDEIAVRFSGWGYRVCVTGDGTVTFQPEPRKEPAIQDTMEPMVNTNTRP
jgi:hypothetical protein